MERQKLSVQLREGTGKQSVKALRRGGEVPAVVYKKGASPVNVRVGEKELLKVLHTRAGENVLLDLEIEGVAKGRKKTVIIKEVQYHPIRNEILHVDFNEILLTETIRVNVPVLAKGEPEGVARDGGTMEYVLREVEIECLPTQIPDGIEIQVAHLKIGDTVYVKDLVAPSGIKITNDPELAVLSIEPPYAEKPAEEAVLEEAAEPEVISREKTEEEKIEEAEAAEKAAAPKEEKKEKQKDVK